MIVINKFFTAKNIIATVLWILTFLWMLLIFGMSAQSGEESSETSNKVIGIVAEVVVPGFSDMTDADKEVARAKLSFPIRKLAHFTEYAVLGELLTASVAFSGKKTSVTCRKLTVALSAGWLYAISDELHQKLVAGRAGMITDVFIDGSGVLVGCVAVALLLLFIFKKVNRDKGLKDCDP